MSQIAIINIEDFETLKTDFVKLSQWDNGAKLPVGLGFNYCGKTCYVESAFEALEVAIATGHQSVQDLKDSIIKREMEAMKQHASYPHAQVLLTAQDLNKKRDEFTLQYLNGYSVELRKAKPLKGRFTERFKNKMLKRT